MRVIPSFDKLEDCHAGFDLGFEAAAVKQLALEGGKETLAHGVIETVPHRAHRRPHPGLVTALAEGERGVLTAMVRVMNHLSMPALSERHVKRCQYQFGAQMSFHRPAHNLAAERVEHHRQVKKAGPGWNVADVSDPQTIWRRNGEGAFNQIWSGFGGAVAHGGGTPSASAGAVKPRRAHQPRHSLVSHVVALRLELGVDPWHAVGCVRAAMNRGDSRA